MPRPRRALTPSTGGKLSLTPCWYDGGHSAAGRLTKLKTKEIHDDQTDKPSLVPAAAGPQAHGRDGKVKQSFSHGRSNTVVVEVKKRRILASGEPRPLPSPSRGRGPSPRTEPAAPAAKPAPKRRSTTSPRQGNAGAATARADEARMNSLEEARRREDRSKQAQTEDEKRRAEDNRKAEEEAEQRAIEEAAEAERRAAEEAAQPASAPVVEQADEDRSFRKPASAPAHAPKRTEPGRPGRGHDERRHAGKLTVSRALTGEDDSRTRSLAALRRAREKEKRAHQQAGPAAKQVRDVQVPETITVQELAKRMGERGRQVSLLKLVTPSHHRNVDRDTGSC